jgi:hypothetical protein
MEELKNDIYFKEGVWDVEKVSLQSGNWVFANFLRLRYRSFP